MACEAPFRRDARRAIPRRAASSKLNPRDGEDSMLRGLIGLLVVIAIVLFLLKVAVIGGIVGAIAIILLILLALEIL